MTRWPIIVRGDVVTATLFAQLAPKRANISRAIHDRDWVALMAWGVKWWDTRTDIWQTYWGPELAIPFRIPKRRQVC